MIDTILFDLDGTLTPIDNEVFVSSYFGNVAKAFSHYDTKKLLKDIMQATQMMITNDGSKTNNKAFWECFMGLGYNESIREEFDSFYLNEFNNVSEHVDKNFSMRCYFDKLKELNYDIILATNPIFPLSASVSRLSWIGLSVDDFSYITTMDNSTYIKPKNGYYLEILNKTGKKAEQCIMVGNNTLDDMSAKEVGMEVFLLPKYIENKAEDDINIYPHGDFDDLLKYLDGLNN